MEGRKEKKEVLKERERTAYESKAGRKEGFERRK